MRKTVSIACIALCMAGCGDGTASAMEPHVMAKRIAECRQHNLKPVPYVNGFTMKIVDIQCQPKPEPKEEK